MCQKHILGNADYADRAQIYADHIFSINNLRVLRNLRSVIAF